MTGNSFAVNINTFNNHIFITSSNDSLTSYVGGGAARCVNEASAISTLMGIPINLFSTGVSNPNSYISGITRTLPKEWPFTGERAIIRDISITYDQNGSGAGSVRVFLYYNNNWTQIGQNILGTQENVMFITKQYHLLPDLQDSNRHKQFLC